MHSESGPINPLMLCATEDCDVAVHAGTARRERRRVQCDMLIDGATPPFGYAGER